MQIRTGGVEINLMKKQGVNPYLPSWEYIPDGEPHVFQDRVYVYGSHDRYNGHVFCLNDYVCWSISRTYGRRMRPTSQFRTAFKLYTSRTGAPATQVWRRSRWNSR